MSILYDTIVPGLGATLTNLLYFSYVPKVRRASARKTVGDCDCKTLAMQFNAAAGWCVYSVVVGSQCVFWGNGPGVIANGYYVTALLQVGAASQDDSALAELLLTVGGGAVLLLAETYASAFLVSTTVATTLCGLTANLFTGAMYVSPCLRLVECFREGTAKYFYPPLVVTTLLNATMWATYGLFSQSDPFIYVPNAVGMVAACVELLVIVLFSANDRQRLGVQMTEDDRQPQQPLLGSALPAGEGSRSTPVKETP